jgi:DNA-binding Lrp family transcriptional regulator
VRASIVRIGGPREVGGRAMRPAIIARGPDRQRFHSGVFWNYVRLFRRLAAPQEISMMKGPKLDRIDLKILSQLQKKGRITNVELADEVGLSPSPCLMRVKRLEKAGYITGYGAQINLAKLGETVLVFTEVTLSDHKREDFAKFEAAIRGVDEILECHLVSGGYDYLLKFVTRGVVHYQSIIENLLERNIGIEKYFSYIVIKSPFVKHHYPLVSLMERETRAAEEE